MKERLAIALALVSVVAFSATIPGRYYVDPENGNNDADGLITIDEVTGAVTTNALKTIGKGLTKAAAGEEVVVVRGVHQISSEVVGSSAKKGVVVRGATDDPADTVLVGSPDHRFYNAPSSVPNDVIMSSMTIRGFGCPNGNGGAVYAGYAGSYCGMVITNCVFEDCTCSGWGGAVFFSGNTYSVVDTVFRRCSSGNNGGAVADEVHTVEYDAVFRGCTFEDNCTTNGGSGGAVYTRFDNENRARRVYVEKCSFLRNHAMGKGSAAHGGGAFGGLAYMMKDCVFTGNYTENLDPACTNCNGGAVHFVGGTTCYTSTLFRCVFRENMSNGAGGAVNFYGGNGRTKRGIRFEGCAFENNYADGRGAVINQMYCSEYFGFFDCVVKGNRTRCDGKSPKTSSADLDYSEVIWALACQVDVKRCRFEKNVCHGVGSAFSLGNAYVGYNRGYTFEDCIFDGNVNATPVANKYTGIAGPVRINVTGNDGEMPSLLVRNCLFANNVNSNGTCAIVYTEPYNLVPNIVVESCTIVGNQGYAASVTDTTAPFGGLSFCNNNNKSKDWSVRNCLFSGNCQLGNKEMVRDFVARVKPAITNCLFASAATDAAANLILADGEQGCLVGCDPRLKDTIAGDYSLMKTSPARDAGLDFDWMTAVGAHDLSLTNRKGVVSARIYGPHVDIGCYEWRRSDGGLMLLLK